ncbi:hypothetical protein, partial [Hyphomonas sp.]|uniref:hypothetical protein n=1 Tax=Hyphomonas sp. TaxID=87 RepID=UPI0032992074
MEANNTQKQKQTPQLQPLKTNTNTNTTTTTATPTTASASCLASAACTSQATLGQVPPVLLLDLYPRLTRGFPNSGPVAAEVRSPLQRLAAREKFRRDVQLLHYHYFYYYYYYYYY